MRRGHSGIGGWRNENPRHFWPRGGGGSRHGSPQQYSLRDLPAKYGYGGPGPRMRGNHHFNTHGPNHRMRGDHRNQFGPRDNRPRFPEPHHFDYPPPPILRHNDSNDTSGYKNMIGYCENRKNEQLNVNSMGDIDDRYNYNVSQNAYSRHPMSPWDNATIENRRTSFDDRSQHKRPNQYHDNVDGNVIPTFTSHRPPSSDHYEGNVATAIDNSNSFSRSVDDTVDIVRRRLLNRNESHNNADPPTHDQNFNERSDTETAMATPYQSESQTPPTRKRMQRRRQNIQSNCDKIKNKIVHQLFKMDKEKIHKLMDNPNSSTKFEYAISSLITESQNSLDRHLRSVAEKSLCSTSTEFIHNDNNTIYEDTFLKQMQCILEPQDTILLEDIKPLVMAELNKVLQLDECDLRFDRAEEDPNYYPQEEPAIQSGYANDYGYGNSDYNNDPPISPMATDNNSYYDDQQSNFPAQGTPESPRGHDRGEQYNYSEPSKLYERRTTRKGPDLNQTSKKRSVSHDRMRRRSIDERNRFNDARRKLVTPPPTFNANVEQLSEEDDPFADLDKQYHVAVDPNFIGAELDRQFDAPDNTNQDVMENKSNIMHLMSSVKDSSPEKPIKRDGLHSPELNPTVIKKEGLASPESNPTTIRKVVDNQVLTSSKSPLKLSSSDNKVRRSQTSSQSKHDEIRRECSDVSNYDNANDGTSTENQFHEMNKDTINHEIMDNLYENKISENSNTLKTTIPLNTRKRSIDQKPSHRKEKRKKSSNSPEPNNQILNKNIIINVNDCGAKSTENKCDAAKSIFNLFFSKDECGKELPKENKIVELSDKGYSDKYVKRKEIPKKAGQESKRKRSTSNSHSIVSPKDNKNSSNETQSKPDAKNKLTTIDMFTNTLVKVPTIHQAHRNTATALTPKKIDPKKTVSGPISKVPKRHIATQVVLAKLRHKETQTSVSKTFVSRFCQSEIKKMVVKAVQTDPVSFVKSGVTSSDTFERMKEIDLEIQVLLQEKFKLYNSLETKESCSNTMQNLGMTVLNVTPIDDNKDDDANNDCLSEDAIVDNFTSIPVEELEQIALESVQEVVIESPKVSKRRQRRKVLSKRLKNAPTPPVRNKANKKVNSPNISLIEQIITDDRPIEDIISLDALEAPAEKPKTVTRKTKNQKGLLTRAKAQTKKQPAKKNKNVKPCSNFHEFKLKECCVVLKREDVGMHLKESANDNTVQNTAVVPEKAVVLIDLIREPETENVQTIEVTDVAEQTVVSVPAADIQFDMLDVSEDIVIGDNYEVKSEEKEAERDVLISEDIILDNSQSSCDDLMPAELGSSENECQTFDYSSDETLKRDSITVAGNADAVLAIECIDNNFIAACLDGNVYHYSGDGQLLTTMRGSNLAVTCLTIVKEKYGTTVYTGSLDSRIRYYDLETGLEKGPECNVLSPIQTMDRAWDTVFVGTRTGFVLQFECRNNMLIPVSTVKFSEQSILALRALKEGPRKVLLVAARSENVTIKDAQTGLLLRTLEGPKMTVYTLLFEDGKVYCGTSSHQIHVFDYASGSACGTHSGGKGAVCLRATGGLVFAGCYDGCVYVFREGEGRARAQLRGPALMLLSLAVLGTKIIAGYKDRSLYIWKIPLSILKEMIL